MLGLFTTSKSKALVPLQVRTLPSARYTVQCLSNNDACVGNYPDRIWECLGSPNQRAFKGLYALFSRGVHLRVVHGQLKRGWKQPN